MFSFSRWFIIFPKHINDTDYLTLFSFKYINPELNEIIWRLIFFFFFTQMNHTGVRINSAHSQYISWLLEVFSGLSHV